MKCIVCENVGGAIAILTPSKALSPEGLVELAKKDAPADTTNYFITESALLPRFRGFREVWRAQGGAVIVDLSASKVVAHTARRRGRDKAMEPLDRKSTIPAEAALAEQDRQAIRDANAALQLEIDACASVDELEVIMLREVLL